MSARRAAGRALPALLALLALTGSAPLHGQGAGSAASTLLRLASAPRALALGNAGVALPDAWSAEYNPALPARGGSHGLALSYQELPVDAATGGAALTAGLGPGVATAALRFVDYGDIEVIEESPTAPIGQPTGTTATGGEIGAAVGYGVRWGRASLGVVARWLRLDVAGLRDDAVAADLGLAVAPARGLILGLVGQYLGGDVTAGRSAPLPRTWRAGASYGATLPAAGGTTVLVALEARHRESRFGGGVGVEAGTEVGGVGAALRLGYETRGGAGDAYAPLVVGGGVRVDRFAIDMAYRTLGPLGSTMLVGLALDL